MPTDDERTMLAEAKAAKPDIPLAPAEDFLYTLASIPELKARLSLWRFNYVFKQIEEVRREGEVRGEGGRDRGRERRERRSKGEGGREERSDRMGGRGRDGQGGRGWIKIFSVCLGVCRCPDGPEECYC